MKKDILKKAGTLKPKTYTTEEDQEEDTKFRGLSENPKAVSLA